jgi:hypothetical protein
VTGLSSREVRALQGAQLDAARLQALLTVSVAGAATPVAGRHVVSGDGLRFMPAFPFDPGREYAVRLDPARLPEPRDGPVIERKLSLPAGPALSPSTVVTAIYPSADVWPENVLRFYIHFSAPMSLASSVGFVRIVDDRGEEVPDALLEMGVNLWNDGRTRCTVFFDPGRVKRGIKPNRDLGRALRTGGRYSVVVDAAWKDGRGVPLKAPFRRDVTAGPPIERGISTSDWRIAPPTAGTRQPLVVTLGWPIDSALARRAMGVTGADGRAIAGEVGLDANETRWTFTPGEAWRAGSYQLAADGVLEDVSGNQIGRAFEIQPKDREARPPPDRVHLGFTIR